MTAYLLLAGAATAMAGGVCAWFLITSWTSRTVLRDFAIVLAAVGAATAMWLAVP